MDLLYPIVTITLLFVGYFTAIFLWKIKGYCGTDMAANACLGTICVLAWPLMLPILLVALLAYGLVVLIVKVKNLARRLKNG